MNELKQTTREALFDYQPAFAALLITAVTIALYAAVRSGKDGTIYFDLCVIALTPFAIVFCNRKWRLGLPLYLITLLCLHSVMSVDMGTALGLYGSLRWWDALVHAFFGFLACATLYCLFFRLKESEPKFLDLICIVLLVIAFAAIWEVYEFVTGAIIGSDMQDVDLLLSQGLNPLTDTMSDMTLAATGAAVFEIGLFFKQQLGRRKEHIK